MVVHVPRQGHIFVTLGLFTLFSVAGAVVEGSLMTFELEFVLLSFASLANADRICALSKDDL